MRSLPLESLLNVTFFRKLHSCEFAGGRVLSYYPNDPDFTGLKLFSSLSNILETSMKIENVEIKSYANGVQTVQPDKPKKIKINK